MPEIISGPWAEIVAGSRAGKATPVSESGGLGNFFQDVMDKLGEKLDPAARGMDAVKTSDNRYFFSMPPREGSPSRSMEVSRDTYEEYSNAKDGLGRYNAAAPVFGVPPVSLGNKMRDFQELHGHSAGETIRELAANIFDSLRESQSQAQQQGLGR